MTKCLTPIVRTGDISQLKTALASKQYNVNTMDEDGYTPLYYACMKEECLEAVPHLLVAGAGVDNKGSDKETPLYIASFNGFVDAINRLLKAGANVNEINGKDKETALHVAAKFGNVEVMKVLIDAGANINFRTSNLETPLYYAASHDKIDAVYLLLECGANKTLANADSKDPLYIASEKAFKGIVEMLKAEKKELSHARSNALLEAKAKHTALTTEQMQILANKEAADPDHQKKAAKPASPAPEPPKMIPIEIPHPVQRDYDPFTGKKLPPCKTMLEAGLQKPPEPSKQDFPEMHANYGGSTMVVGAGTDEARRPPLFEPQAGDVFDYVVLPPDQTGRTKIVKRDEHVKATA